MKKVVCKDSRHRCSDFSSFYKINSDELWLAFGTGANFWYIPIHEVVTNMNPRIRATLQMFHVISGLCNMVSAFCGEVKDSTEYMESLPRSHQEQLMQI